MRLPIPKKIVLLFIFLVLGFVSTKTVLALNTGWSPEQPRFGGTETYQDIFNKNVYSPEINQPSFTNETMKAVIASLNDKILGCAGQNCPAVKGAQSQGVVGGITDLIAAIYTHPPASSITYLANLGKNLGIAQPAYAQGVAFSTPGLQPILKIWTVFRNLAYLFFTIIFIVIGFAIMFRVKISPQAVITIQSALPRIILALVLVTFSYAIAGFMIDLMYVVILLGIAVLGPVANVPITELQKIYVRGGFTGIIGEAFGIAGAGIPGGIWAAMTGLGAVVGGLITGLIGLGTLTVLAGFAVGAGLFALIIAIIILYVLFKLLVELIKAYISVLLLIIFAPLQIMLDAIPGQSGFGNWFRNLVANLAVFPAVALFFLIAKIMTGLEVGKLWTPPMTVGTDMVAALIGFGMLLLASKVPEMVKNAFGLKPFPYGTAIGEAMAIPRGTITTGGMYAAKEMQPQTGRIGATGHALEYFLKNVIKS